MREVPGRQAVDRLRDARVLGEDGERRRGAGLLRGVEGSEQVGHQDLGVQRPGVGLDALHVVERELVSGVDLLAEHLRNTAVAEAAVARVSEVVDGLRLAVVAERLAQIVERARDGGVAHADARPDAREQLLLAHPAVPVEDQVQEHREELRLQLDRAAVAAQLARDGIELERAEDENHSRAPPPGPSWQLRAAYARGVDRWDGKDPLVPSGDPGPPWPTCPLRRAQRGWLRRSAQDSRRETSAGDSRFAYQPIHASGETGATPRLRWIARSTFSATRSGP